MAGSINKVILVGNLGRDPEVRRTNSGSPIVSFSMAMTESWRDKASGERREKTEWANIVIFNEALAKVAEQSLKKGMKVYVEGQLQTREYTDKDGNQRKATDVVVQNFRGDLQMLDSRGRGDGPGDDAGADYGGGPAGGGASFGRSSPMDSRAPARPAPDRRPATAGGGRMSEPMDDDIPF